MATIVNTVTEGWTRASRSQQQPAEFMDERRSDAEIREINWIYALDAAESGSSFKLNSCFSGNRTYLRVLDDNDEDTNLRVIGRIIDCSLPVSLTLKVPNKDGDFIPVEEFTISEVNGYDMHNPVDLQLLANINIGKYMRENYQPLDFMGDTTSAISNDILIISNDANMKIDAIEMRDITPASDDNDQQGETDNSEALLIIRELLADLVNDQTLIKSMLTDLTNKIESTNTAVINQSKAITILQGDTFKCSQAIATLKTSVSSIESKCTLLDTVITNIDRLNIGVSDTRAALPKIDKDIDDIKNIVKSIDISVRDTASEPVTSSNSWKRQALICAVACISVITSNLISSNKNRSS